MKFYCNHDERLRGKVNNKMTQGVRIGIRDARRGLKFGGERGSWYVKGCEKTENEGKTGNSAKRGEGRGFTVQSSRGRNHSNGGNLILLTLIHYPHHLELVYYLHYPQCHLEKKNLWLTAPKGITPVN